MKTLLFAPMWLDGSGRLERNIKWLNYYNNLKMKKLLGYDDILLVDNDSSDNSRKALQFNNPNVIIKVCKPHYSRTAHLEYEYWYRAFREAAQYALDNGYDKIIHIDTDVYVLRAEIAEYVKLLTSGWTSMWCSKYNFAESTFQVIGEDSISTMLEFMTTGYKPYFGKEDAENIIPWTHKEKSFKGDRYGETYEVQTSDMQYYCQCPNEIGLVYEIS